MYITEQSRDDHAVIRNRRLEFSTLVDPRLFDPAHIESLRAQVQEAVPFPHLVVDGWFHPTLLELAREEFDLFGSSNWKTVAGEQERLHRSVDASKLGPASQIYFNIVNSGWFLDLLSHITGVEDLLPDTKLLAGGLHEIRSGGVFGVHRDFDRHARHGFDNKMVFITYLNKGWDPSWGAALELWGGAGKCVRSVLPEFGRSILMLHGSHSFHGHPDPMKAPEGMQRRSLASYYYTNPIGVQQRIKRVTTVFLYAHRAKGLRRWVFRVTPPIIIEAIKKLVSQ